MPWRQLYRILGRNRLCLVDWPAVCPLPHLVGLRVDRGFGALHLSEQREFTKYLNQRPCPMHLSLAEDNSDDVQVRFTSPNGVPALFPVIVTTPVNAPGSVWHGERIVLYNNGVTSHMSVSQLRAITGLGLSSDAAPKRPAGKKGAKSAAYVDVDDEDEEPQGTATAQAGAAASPPKDKGKGKAVAASIDLEVEVDDNATTIDETDGRGDDGMDVEADGAEDQQPPAEEEEEEVIILDDSSLADDGAGGEEDGTVEDPEVELVPEPAQTKKRRARVVPPTDRGLRERTKPPTAPPATSKGKGKKKVAAAKEPTPAVEEDPQEVETAAASQDEDDDDQVGDGLSQAQYDAVMRKMRQQRDELKEKQKEQTAQMNALKQQKRLADKGTAEPEDKKKGARRKDSVAPASPSKTGGKGMSFQFSFELS